MQFGKCNVHLHYNKQLKQNIMQASELKTKKITMSTLKSFINKSVNLFVQEISSFDGMTDCVQSSSNRGLIKIDKQNAIGHNGVWCVGQSRDRFEYKETETHYGIEVYNCCGSGILWTNK